MSLWQTTRFAVHASQLGKVPRWNPRRVQRLADRRLRRLVRYAVARSPFYRQKYRHVDLRHFSLADLPPTGKEELRLHFDDAVTDPRLSRTVVESFLSDTANLGRWLLGKYAVSHTSGSQGPPLLIVQNRRALEVLFGIMSSRANASGAPGVVEGVRKLTRPARMALVVQHRGFYPSAAAFEYFPQVAGRFVKLEWLSATDPDLISRLNDFQPTVMVAYASVLEALALQSDLLKLRSLQQVGNSSEQLTARARQRIRAAFNVPIMDHYGTGECLMLSDGCPTHGGAHINADWAQLEVVDHLDRPVAPGTAGKKVLITNLANTVQPFIRYEVGDQVTLATEPCSCGSRLPRIERIDGRTAELFWVATVDGNAFRMLPGVLFHSAVDALPGVREWRAVQVARNQVEVQLELLPHVGLSLADAQRFLVERLREFGLPAGVRVDARIVLRLHPDEKTGKFKRMVSQVGPPSDKEGGPALSQQALCGVPAV